MDYPLFLSSIQDTLVSIRKKKALDEVMALILERACHMSSAVHGSFVKVNPKTKELAIVSTYGEDWTEEKKQCRMKVGEGITGMVAMTGKPHLVHDTHEDPHYFALFSNVRSELTVPVIVDEAVWGIINLDGYEPEAFNEETLNMITLFSELAANALSIRKEYEHQESLQQRLVQSEKLAALGQVIAGIAHEINNPLTAILGHASLLEMKADPADAKSLRAIVSESQRVATLVKELLNFSRRTSSKPVVVGANEIIQQTCNLMKHPFKVKGVALKHQPSEVSYPIKVDPQQLQQAVINLMTNAMQAMPEGKTDGLVLIETERKGERVSIKITDNGRGIPSAINEKVFDPFFTTKPVGQGTGLGLSISTSIIEKFGGNLSFKSKEGGPTTFCIDLPLGHGAEVEMRVETQPAVKKTEKEEIASFKLEKPKPENAVPAATPLPTQPVEPKQETLGKVLVIDDEEMLLGAVTQHLQNENFEVDKASSAEEALKKLREKVPPYDAVLSDIRLPHKDGLEIYAEIIREKPYYERHFIFMTGDLIRDSTRTRVSKTQCYCIEKPFSFDILKNSLIHVMGRDVGVNIKIG